MTLKQALDTGLNIYASYGDATVNINKCGGVQIMRDLPNGKTEFCWYSSSEYARKEHPLDKLNWHVTEN